MGTLVAGSAFQATDLPRNHRVVLEAARKSGALIRDKDGTLLVIRRADEEQAREFLSKELLNLVYLTLAFQVSPEQRTPAHYGDLAWLSVLPENDQHKFGEAITRQILITKNSGSTSQLEQLIEDWRATALTWSEKELRDNLTQDLDSPLSDVLL